MQKLLIATRSKGKFPEIISVLDGVPFEIMNLNDVPELPKGFEVEEVGNTFEGNAIIKAMTIGTITGQLTVAEDSGLCVDALDGRPGVFTARYAPGTDQDRYMKLLGELDGVSPEKRTARFVAVVALYDPVSHRIFITEGTQEGLIAEIPTGENGFGYDPVFFNRALGKTTAQATIEEKNSVSHRGQAFRKMKDILIREKF